MTQGPERGRSWDRLRQPRASSAVQHPHLRAGSGPQFPHLQNGHSDTCRWGGRGAECVEGRGAPACSGVCLLLQPGLDRAAGAPPRGLRPPSNLPSHLLGHPGTLGSCGDELTLNTTPHRAGPSIPGQPWAPRLGRTSARGGARTRGPPAPPASRPPFPPGGHGSAGRAASSARG